MQIIYSENDNYIIAFVKEQEHDLEYEQALEFLKTKPLTQEGYEYAISKNMEWELIRIEEENTDGI